MIISAANAEERLVGGVPIPDDVAVSTVPESVPAPVRLFSGV